MSRTCRSTTFRGAVVDGVGAGRRVAALFGAMRRMAATAVRALSPSWPTTERIALSLAAPQSWSRAAFPRSRPIARRPISSSARSPSSSASCRRAIPGSSRCASMPLPAGTTPGAGPGADARVGVMRLLSRRGRRDPRGGRRARCMPASSSRGISASSATASRSSTWRSRSAISTAASSEALVGGPDKRTLHYVETVAGDTTDRPRHRLLPGRRGARRLPGARPRPRSSRGIALELERLANHIGDLGRPGRRRRLSADGVASAAACAATSST